MILESQHGVGKVSAGKVARWMASNGLRYGYKTNSLRTMVYRAFEAIDILETFVPRSGGGPAWPVFDPEGRTSDRGSDGPAEVATGSCAEPAE
jgi:hypothetical protein